MEKPVFKLKHLGINHPDAEAGCQQAALFADLFGYTIKELPTSLFAGTDFEIMKYDGPGVHGHISLGVDSIEDAIAYLTEKGVEIDMASGKKNEDGQLVFIYINQDFAGFRIHLNRN